MPRTGWTPSIMPDGADQTVYLIVYRFGGLGNVYRESNASGHTRNGAYPAEDCT